MTKETKVKWRMRGAKVVRVIKELVAPIFVGATVGAAWGGFMQSRRDSKAIGTLIEHVNKNTDIYNENFNILVRQQNLLFEKALKETEGKPE